MSESMKLESAIDEFLIASRADGLQETTLAWYGHMLKPFAVFFAGRSLESISTNDLRLYIIKIRSEYSPDTAHGHVRTQHRFWKWCNLEYSTPNPMRNIAYPTLPKQVTPKAVDVADISKMFRVFKDTYADKRDKAILCFLADTGCRVTGLCTLTIENLDMQRHKATVTEKGRKTRNVVFTEFTAGVLQVWLDVRADVVPVFYNLTTLEPLTRFGVEQMLTRLRKRAGVKGRTNPHAFRHAFGREYLRNGGDLATLSRLLGHADVETTLKYYTLFTDDELAKQHEQYSPIKNIKES